MSDHNFLKDIFATSGGVDRLTLSVQQFLIMQGHRGKSKGAILCMLIIFIILCKAKKGYYFTHGIINIAAVVCKGLP